MSLRSQARRLARAARLVRPPPAAHPPKHLEPGRPRVPLSTSPARSSAACPPPRAPSPSHGCRPCAQVQRSPATGSRCDGKASERQHDIEAGDCTVPAARPSKTADSEEASRLGATKVRRVGKHKKEAR